MLFCYPQMGRGDSATTPPAAFANVTAQFTFLCGKGNAFLEIQFLPAFSVIVFVLATWKFLTQSVISGVAAVTVYLTHFGGRWQTAAELKYTPDIYNTVQVIFYPDIFQTRPKTPRYQKFRIAIPVDFAVQAFAPGTAEVRHEFSCRYGTSALQ